MPAFILGLIISTLYGAAFHLWIGGRAGRLLLYLVLGWVGFLTGHLIAMFQGWTFLSIGTLHLGLATISSMLFLLIGHWLSLVEARE